MWWSREWVAASEEVISLSLFISSLLFLEREIEKLKWKASEWLIFSSFMCSSIAKRETATLRFPALGENISHMTWRDRWGKGISRIEFALYFGRLKNRWKLSFVREFRFYSFANDRGWLTSNGTIKSFVTESRRTFVVISRKLSWDFSLDMT